MQKVELNGKLLYETLFCLKQTFSGEHSQPFVENTFKAW